MDIVEVCLDQYLLLFMNLLLHEFGIRRLAIPF